MTQRGQAVPLPGTQVTEAITVVLPGFVDIVSQDITANWLRITRPNKDTFNPGTVHVTAKTAPGATIVKFDVMVSTNNGVSFVSALSPDTKITLPIGAHVNTLDTLIWTTPEFNDGDLLRIDILQTDASAVGISFQILPT